MLKNSLSPRLLKPGCSKRSRCKAVREGRSTRRRWVQAYFRYAATSAQAEQRRRSAFFSSLLVEEIECDVEGDVECRQLLRAEVAYVVCQGTLR